MIELIKHPVQTIMSRTGSFPLEIAYNLVQQYSKPGSVIFDPFCGKGTTLLAARLHNCPTYGIDIAPEAVVCSYAKILDVTLDDVCDYVSGLNINARSVGGIPSSIHTFFNAYTLSQILSLRESIICDTYSKDRYKRINALFTLASLLGILHGHASYSLSISSSHAYSMSPRYVREYAIKHGLKPPIRDVKKCLITKITRCLKVPLPRFVLSDVRRGSALFCSSIFPELINNVDLIITSPPYLNAQTYAKDNWLRLWLLGYNYKELQN